jgi:hypothetical protein
VVIGFDTRFVPLVVPIHESQNGTGINQPGWQSEWQSG